MAKTCEEIFYQEFMAMMNQRKAYRGVIALNNIPLPPNNWGVDTHDKVMIRGINEEYYNKLNDTEAILWSKPRLVRRKFDHNMQFIMRKDDPSKPELEEVTLPHKCVAIVSEVKIDVPYSVETRTGKRVKYKASDGFEYVDVINKVKPNGERIVRYIYIVPKVYCYKENQVALVISFNRLRSYYSGAQVSLTNGQYLYLHVIPYKPTSNVSKNYRVLKTQTSSQDFNEDVKNLVNFWVSNSVMFNPSDCVMYEGYKGKENLAYELMPPVLEEFVTYDPLHSMADDAETEDDLNLFNEE